MTRDCLGIMYWLEVTMLYLTPPLASESHYLQLVLAELAWGPFVFVLLGVYCSWVEYSS